MCAKTNDSEKGRSAVKKRWFYEVSKKEAAALKKKAQQESIKAANKVRLGTLVICPLSFSGSHEIPLFFEKARQKEKQQVGTTFIDFGFRV